MIETGVVILYTNHRDETAARRIVPRQMWFGRTEWHPQIQWLLDAFDVDRGAQRTFAMKDIHQWAPAANGKGEG